MEAEFSKIQNPKSKMVYDLRITAELWETHFFDHLSLMAVDHPQGTEIFCDERFAVPPPPLQVYAVTPPRPVSRAWDDDGQGRNRNCALPGRAGTSPTSATAPIRA